MTRTDNTVTNTYIVMTQADHTVTNS